MKVLETTAGLLSFRLKKDEFHSFGLPELIFGLLCTWLVGMGRWWDDPKAEMLQKSGVGSLAYIVGLSLLLFAVGYPLRRQRWRYLDVLTFVGLTAAPAALYAIPIERFMSMGLAAYVNLAFLLIVATWRVGLLGFFLRRYGQYNWLEVFVVMLLPLACIVMVASFLDLQRGLIQIMGGVRNESADTLAAGLVVAIGVLTYLAIIPLVIGYGVLVFVARKIRKQELVEAVKAKADAASKVPPKAVA